MRSAFFAALLGLLVGLAVPVAAAESPKPPPLADVWRAVRLGEAGTVNNFPDPLRGRLIQSAGEVWRNAHNDWLRRGAAVALIGVTLALAAFYRMRGMIRIEAGRSGRLIKRFNRVERFGHWLTAGSFLVLALTGLNMLFGRLLLEPLIGKAAFAWLTMAGKWAHNLGGFLFIAGLALIFLLWARDNLWDRYDWGWIKEGGGLLKKGRHPPAAKFNFGEKTQFWLVILVGSLVSATGINLLFPFAFADLPGLQVMQILHAAAAVGMVMAIMGHIYIGTIGMEGAREAMTTGYVDENWAREHHSVWVEDLAAAKTGRVKPAE